MSQAIAHLSGYEKAATLLILLGDKASAEILRRLSEEEVEHVGRVISGLHTISSEQAEHVLEEYVQMATARRYVLKGGTDYARKMLTGAFGPDSAERLMQRFSVKRTDGDEHLREIERASPQQLAQSLQAEHPQAIALVLSRVAPNRAAAALQSLPNQVRTEVTLRLVHLDQIPSEVVYRIAGAVSRKLRSLGEVVAEIHGGVKAAAEILNQMDAQSAEDILAGMEQADANIAESVRNLMFVFDDLVKLDPSAFKELLNRVDRKVLTLALKGTGEDLKQKFLKSMSQRGAEMLQEDLEALGPVRIRDVEGAQQQILGLVRELEREGAISTSGEQYVV